MYWWVSLATRRKANWCKPTNFQKSVQFEPGLCFISHPMPYIYLYPKDLKPQLSSNQKASECYKWCFKSKAVSQWKWLQPSICAFENSVPIKPFFKDLRLQHTFFFFSSKLSLMKSWQQSAKCGSYPRSFVFLALCPFYMWNLFQIYTYTLWKNEDPWDFFIATNERSDCSVIYLVTVYKGWSFLRKFFSLSSEQSK